MFEVLEIWQKTILATDEQINKIRNLFNCVECEPIDAFEKLQMEYTRSIAKEIGDHDAHWLLWFWLDNSMGKKGLSAGYDGDINPITGLGALEELILEGLKPGEKQGN
jgi:hypothetical protein